MSGTRRFRFGIVLGVPGEISTRNQWRDVVRKAEDLGYATVLVPDHFWIPFGPVAALVVAAESTTHIRVGSFVFANDFRHPAVLAKDAATIDLLTDGRFELGLGAGYGRDEYAQAGLPFDSARTRIERLSESVQ